jgi:sugar phosphate isomerase/epimerase
MPQKFHLRIATSSHLLVKFTLHEAIEILGKIGYDAIEIWAVGLEQQLAEKKTSYAKIRAALFKYRMMATLHAPTADYKTKEMLNVCSKNTKLRKKSIQKNLAAMDYAHKLGCHVITIHPGHMDLPTDKVDETYWKLQIDAFKVLAKKAEKLNLDLGIELMENRPKEFVMEPPAIHKIIHAVNSKHVGVTVDLTHAFTHGMNKPIEFLESCRERIFHAHMSGYTTKKTHVPLYMSAIPTSYLDNALIKLTRHHAGWIAVEGHLKGIMADTKANEKMVAKKNYDFITRELKSLHLI